MLRLKSYITFTKSDGREFYFDFCHMVETDESWENYTKTAKITVPRKVKDKGKNLFVGNDAIFRRGDKVKIELGYFPKLRTVFEGYIAKVSSNIPIEIMCEDEMFLLKNTNIKKYSAKAPTLKQLLIAILPSKIKFECIDVNLGSFRVTNSSITSVLDELRTGYGLFSYFRDGKLYVGLPSNAAVTNTENFTFEETIINEDDLDWQQAEDISIKVKAISMQPDNTKKEIEVGDSDGAQRTYHLYNATDAALKEFANLKLNEIKYTGFVGTVETFGEPYVRQGDIAHLASKKLPERDGDYLIKDVKRKFGWNIGYRQYLGLESRV